MSENDRKLWYYIDRDVYQEAKLRIIHTMELFDDAWVAFSGGKDSLVTLLLVEEVFKEHYPGRKVNVFFRDEELIPDTVLDFVESYRAQTDRFNFIYLAVPLVADKYVLGRVHKYIQWAPARRWVRPKPPHAITADVVLDQYTTDAFIYELAGMKGRVAFFTGVRADESLFRLRSVINKKNENYICGCQDPRIKLVKPIYDWNVKDIFKYIMDSGQGYNPIYDAELWNGDQLRVATPVHAEAAKNFHKVRTRDPQLYQQIVQIFPEMLLQERYYSQLDTKAVYNQYPHTWDGIFKFIEENITDKEWNALARERVRTCITIRNNNLRALKNVDSFGGYPVLYVFKTIVGGGYKRVIQPVGRLDPKKIDLYREYEHGNYH